MIAISLGCYKEEVIFNMLKGIPQMRVLVLECLLLAPASLAQLLSRHPSMPDTSGRLQNPGSALKVHCEMNINCDCICL